jgi:hypothetical protein
MTKVARKLVDRAEPRPDRTAEAATTRPPRWLAQMSFRNRLVWLCTAAVAFAVVLAAVISFTVVRNEMRSQVDEELAALVDEIVRVTPTGVIVDTPDPLKRTADYAQVVQRSGTVIPPSEGRVNVRVGERTLDAAAAEPTPTTRTRRSTACTRVCTRRLSLHPRAAPCRRCARSKRSTVRCATSQSR